MGRRCVDQDTAGLHGCCVFCHFLLLVDIDVQRRGMAIAAVCNQPLSLCNGLVKGLCLVHSQNWGQLLVSKLFRNIYRLYFTDQDLGIFRNLNTCQFCNGVSALTNDLGI